MSCDFPSFVQPTHSRGPLPRTPNLTTSSQGSRQPHFQGGDQYSPEVDKELESLQNLSQDELRAMLGQSVRQPIGAGTTSKVYEIHGRSHVLLKERGQRLKVVPIAYSDSQKALLKQGNMGLPIAVVVEESSAIGKKASVTSVEAQTAGLQILKKVGGQPSNQPYFDALNQLYSGENTKIPEETKKLFSDFKSGLNPKNLKTTQETADKVAVTFLDLCAEGNYKYSDGPISGYYAKHIYEGKTPETFASQPENSNTKSLDPDNAKAFAQVYQQFATQYIENLQKIADMPQEAFDKALSTINQLKDNLDLTHEQNVLIDHQSKSFNFVDVDLNPSEAKKSTPENIDAFVHVLLGHNNKIAPQNLIVRDNDRLALKTALNSLIDKLEKAAKKNKIAWNSSELKNLRERFALNPPQGCPAASTEPIAQPFARLEKPGMWTRLSSFVQDLVDRIKNFFENLFKSKPNSTPATP